MLVMLYSVYFVLGGELSAVSNYCPFYCPFQNIVS